MNGKQYKRQIVTGLLIVMALLLAGAGRLLTGQLKEQNVASEWSKKDDYVQLSCFFSKDAGMTSEQILPVERQLTEALQNAAAENESGMGRSYVDAYSSQGQLTVYSDKTSVTVRAFGVGGDFFQFHPLKLLDGTYFDGNDFNGDGVILDENVAWQLFGGNHISGMTVEIDNVVYPVRGVVRSDSGFFSEAAEEEKPTIYVSYGILAKGKEEPLPVDSYELLILNPVKQFGFRALKDALGLDETAYEIVENTTRYGLLNRLALLKNFGVRSMRTKNIVFPYWENRARAYEDVVELLFVLELLCLIYPAVRLVRFLHGMWKRRKKLVQNLWKFLKELYKRVAFYRQ